MYRRQVLHPAPAEGFGAALKRAREAQGISIGDMAARSRLSVQQVRALESERTAELPEPVYVRAFIRGVASVLGLEPDPLVADYTARYGAASVGVLPDHDPAKETVVRASGRRTGLKAAVVAIAAVLVCAAGLLKVLFKNVPRIDRHVDRRVLKIDRQCGPEGCGGG